MLQVRSCFSKRTPGKHLSDKLTSNGVSAHIPTHEVNYYGPIKHGGIVTECKLGQENKTHSEVGQKVPWPLTPLCLCSYAGRVGSAFENKRKSPEASVRNADPVLKGVKLRLEQLTQVHKSHKCPSDMHQEQQQDTYITQCGLVTFHLALHFVTLSPWLGLWPAVWSDVHGLFPKGLLLYFWRLTDLSSSTRHSPNLPYWQEILWEEKWESPFFLHSFFTSWDIFHFFKTDARHSSTRIILRACTLAPPMLIITPQHL